jgi:hypothetical protein
MITVNDHIVMVASVDFQIMHHVVCRIKLEPILHKHSDSRVCALDLTVLKN